MCKQLCFLPGKSINRGTKVQTWNFSELCNFNLHSAVLTILTSIHSLCYFHSENCKTSIWFSRQTKTINYLLLRNTFPVEKATPTNKKKLAALNKELCEEHPRNILAQNSNVPRSQEEYITQVSEEIEGRVRKKLSKEFSRTENRILGALARLDDFLMNQLLQGDSGTTPEASRNALSTSQGTNENDSQKDPHPEAGLFYSQMTQNSGPEEGHDSSQLHDQRRGVVSF